MEHLSLGGGVRIPDCRSVDISQRRGKNKTSLLISKASTCGCISKTPGRNSKAIKKRISKFSLVSNKSHRK